MVQVHDFAGNGQPQAGALTRRFGGEKWIEYFVQDLGSDAGTGVGNPYFRNSFILPEARAGTIARVPFYFVGAHGPHRGKR